MIIGVKFLCQITVSFSVLELEI